MGHGEFLWSDLATFDVASTLEFYHDVIGWTYRREPVAGGPDYYYASGSGAAVAGIYEMPNVFRDGGMESFWMSYIGIDDIEAGIARAVELGGSVIMGPARFGESAAIAMLRDPQGAIFSLYHGDNLQPQGREPAEGAQFWNDLICPNAEQAAAFYGGLFGWQFGPLWPDKRCRIRNLADGFIASLRQQPGPASWRVSFAVSDPDAAVTSVNGATTGEGDIGYTCRDGNGAEFHLTGLRLGRQFHPRP